ncbi:MAG TPA: hypothetical protein VJ901_19505 [Thermoanaerobaculia bacterium]|nr:hypothetical protein [Thermoanaerobaculia bacterium]
MTPLYEALLERDEPATRRAIEEFAGDHELFLAVARFAVLAYAPSQHAKHAFLACLAAYDLRDELGASYREMLTECAIYTGGSRLPWSEPPILEPPHVDEEPDLDAAIRDGDRLAAEHWLAYHLDDPDLERLYFDAASRDFEDLGHKLIISRAAWRLIPILGDKGRFALLRCGVWEWTAYRGETFIERGAHVDRDVLIDRLVHSDGSLISTHDVFLLDAALGTHVEHRVLEYLSNSATQSLSNAAPQPLRPYRLARDYAQTLIAHAVAQRIPAVNTMLPAVHENLDHSQGFEEWSFA